MVHEFARATGFFCAQETPTHCALEECRALGLCWLYSRASWEVKVNHNKYIVRALRKGTVMAFANASIVLLIATIADAVRSIWTIVIIVLASALAYFAAYHEAKFDDEQIAREREVDGHQPGGEALVGDKPIENAQERLEIGEEDKA